MTLRRLISFAALLAVVCCPGLAFGQQVIVIDTFDIGSGTRSVPGFGADLPINGLSSIDPLITSGQRVISIEGTGGLANLTSDPLPGGGLLVYNSLASGSNRLGTVEWNLDPTSLTGLGLFGFDFEVAAISGLANVSITVFGFSGGESNISVPVNTVGHHVVLFSNFDSTSAFGDAVQIKVQFGNTADPFSISLNSFAAIPEASPLWMLVGAIGVVGGGRYGWKRYKTRRELAS